MRTLPYATSGALALTLALAACGPKAETQPAEATPAAAAPGSDAMGGMEMASGEKMAKGTGVVTAVDATRGSVTINHGPIAEASWPAMEMAFKADPALLKEVKVGDKVAFDLKLKDGAGEVTGIQKR
jgi:Cu(I)/Ag(I) efflux system protein CusF